MSLQGVVLRLARAPLPRLGIHGVHQPFGLVLIQHGRQIPVDLRRTQCMRRVVGEHPMLIGPSEETTDGYRFAGERRLAHGMRHTPHPHAQVVERDIVGIPAAEGIERFQTLQNIATVRHAGVLAESPVGAQIFDEPLHQHLRIHGTFHLVRLCDPAYPVSVTVVCANDPCITIYIRRQTHPTHRIPSDACPEESFP